MYVMRRFQTNSIHSAHPNWERYGYECVDFILIQPVVRIRPSPPLTLVKADGQRARLQTSARGKGIIRPSHRKKKEIHNMREYLPLSLSVLPAYNIRIKSWKRESIPHQMVSTFYRVLFLVPFPIMNLAAHWTKQASPKPFL